MDDEASDTFAPHSQHRALSPPHRVQGGSEAWSKDKKALVAWAGGLLGTSVLGWGIWITVQVFSCQRDDALQLARIEASERAAQERVGEIRSQLVRIEARLAEIQVTLYRARP